MTFVILFVLSATGTIYMAKTANNKPVVDTGGNTGSAETTTFLTDILSTFEKNKVFNVQGNASLSYGETQLDLELYVNVDITDGIVAEGYVHTALEGKKLEIGFVFYLDTIYLSVNGVCIKGNINTIMKMVSEFMGGGSGSLDFDKILEGYMPAIMTAMNNPKTEQLSDGSVKNTIDIEGLAVAGLVTSKEGLLSKIEAKTYDLKGFVLEANLEVVFDNDIKIENPEEALYQKEYVSAESLLNIAKEVASWRDIELGIDLSLGIRGKNYDLSADVLANIMEQNFSFNLGSSSIDEIKSLKATYFDKNVYLNLNDMNLMLSSELLGVAADSARGEILKIFEEIKAKLLGGKLNLSKIMSVLSEVQEFSLSDHGFKIAINSGLFEIEFNERGELELFAEYENSDASVKLSALLKESTEKVEKIDASDYLDVYRAYTSSLELFKNTEFKTTINGTYMKSGEKLFGLSGSLDFDLKQNYFSILADASFGKDYALDVLYSDNVAFVKFANIALRLDSQKLKELMSGLGATDQMTEKLGEILGKVKQMFESVKAEDVLGALNMLKSIKINGEGIEILVDLSELGMNIEASITLSLENGSLKSFSIKDLALGQEDSLNLSLEIESMKIERRTASKEDYLDAAEFVENLIALKDINSAKLTAAMNLKLDGERYNVNAIMGFDRLQQYMALKGNLSSLEGDFNFDLAYLGGELFASINNIKIKAAVESIKEIFGSFGSNEKLDFDAIIKQIQNGLGGFDISAARYIKNLTVNSSQIALTLDGELLNTLGDLSLVVMIENNEISSIEVINFKISESSQVGFKVQRLKSAIAMPNVDSRDYLDILALYNNILALESAKNLNLLGRVDIYNITAGGYALEYQAELNAQLTKLKSALEGYMSLILSTEGKDLTLGVNLQDREIFANFSGLKLKIANNEIMSAVHRVLALLGKDENAYDDILNRIISILSGSSLKSAFEGFELDNKVDFGKNIHLSGLVRDILLGSEINANVISLDIDGANLGLGGRVRVVIDINNNAVNRIRVEKLEIMGKALDLDISVDTLESENKLLSSAEKEEYMDITRLLGALDATINTLKNGSISGKLNLDFVYGKEHNVVTATYGIKLQGNKLSLYIKAAFNGLSVNVYYMDEAFYVDIGGVNNSPEDRVQVTAKFSEFKDIVDYLNEKFKLNINIDFENVDNIIAMLKNIDFGELDIKNMLFGKDFGVISHIDFNESSLEAYFKNNISLFVSYNEEIERLSLKLDGLALNIACESFDEVHIESLDKSTYAPYTALTDFVDSVMNLLSSNPFEMFGTVDMFGSDQSNTSLKLGYQDDYLFIDIMGMKLRLARQSLAEILGVVLQSLGIDPSLISFIGDVTSSEELDFENLQNIIPNIDMGNPFNMLKFVKSISLHDGSFKISLDSAMFGTAGGEDMVIALQTAEGRTESFEISNVEVSKSQKVNAKLNFERGIEENSYGEYIDLSNSADLVKAFVNTSALSDFLIQGNIQLSIALGKLQLNAATLGVDIRLQLDSEKNPTVAIELSSLPLIGGVTNANTNGVGALGGLSRYRKISIFFKDGGIYLRTVDEKWGAYKEFTRITKISLDTLIKNLGYYVQWVMGLSDSIMEKINESIEKSNAYEGDTDFSKIILDYSKSGDRHNIVINLEEITHNSDVGTLTLGITTKRDAANDNKNYLYSLDMDLNVLGGMIILKTDEGNKLYLNNIGKPVDLSSANSYIDSYPYNENAEYEKKGDGSFSQINRNKITISLDNNGGEGATSVVGYLGDDLTLPTPTKIVDDGITRETYRFIGYYTSSGKLFTAKAFPRQNITLYARYELQMIEEYRTLTLVNGANAEAKKYLQNSIVKIDELQNYVFDNGVIRTEYTFIGWRQNGVILGRAPTIALSEDMTLEAVFTQNTKSYISVTLDKAGKGDNVVIKKLEGESIMLESLANFEEYNNEGKFVYAFNGWIDQDGEIVTSLVLTQNQTLQASWTLIESFVNRTLTLKHGDKVVGTYVLASGDEIRITSDYIRADGSTKFYLDKNFSSEYVLGSMPNSDLTLYVRNRFTINFNSNGGSAVSSITAYEGEQITTLGATKANTGKYIEYLWTEVKYKWEITSYSFAGWTNANGSSFTGVMPDQDITLVASWYSETVTEKVGYSQHKDYQKIYG